MTGQPPSAEEPEGNEENEGDSGTTQPTLEELTQQVKDLAAAINAHVALLKRKR